MVVYTHQEDKGGELEAKARAGVIPIVTSTPGYISYEVMFEDDNVVSISSLNEWRPGAKTLTKAESDCSSAHFEGNGHIVITQFVSTNLDYDYSCI